MLALLVAALSTAAFLGGDDEAASREPQVVATDAAGFPVAPENLPNGARSIFPEHRVVSLYGAPQDRALGGLGIGTPDAAGQRLLRQAAAYEDADVNIDPDDELPVLPAFHLLAVIAANAPGEEGLYRNRQPTAVIRRYLAAARRAGAILLLDIQPGRAGFMDEVRVLRPFLREPDVSLAIDPEWHVGPDQVPGQDLGTVDAAAVNDVSRYLAGIVAAGDLPDKILMVHQFVPSMITRRPMLREREGIDLAINIDGFGTRAEKRAKYDTLTQDDGPWTWGFKVFYEEDTELLSPNLVVALKPPPSLVVYE